MAHVIDEIKGIENLDTRMWVIGILGEHTGGLIEFGVNEFIWLTLRVLRIIDQLHVNDEFFNILRIIIEKTRANN